MGSVWAMWFQLQLLSSALWDKKQSATITQLCSNKACLQILISQADSPLIPETLLLKSLKLYVKIRKDICILRKHKTHATNTHKISCFNLRFNQLMAITAKRGTLAQEEMCAFFPASHVCSAYPLNLETFDSHLHWDPTHFQSPLSKNTISSKQDQISSSLEIPQ